MEKSLKPIRKKGKNAVGTQHCHNLAMASKFRCYIADEFQRRCDVKICQKEMPAMSEIIQTLLSHQRRHDV